ncbi:MAG: sugar phosphate isomerase/epimerase [Clostridia bacterium]|nr:sugar phosphate isomerase/epimerase [Clostridia bacterium]
MKRKLGIITSCLPGKSEYDALDYIADAGFEMVFCDEFNQKEILRLKEKCDRLGIALEFLHAPYAGVNQFWNPGDAYLKLRDGIYSSIEGASEAGIPVVVSHVSSGWFPPLIYDFGLARFDELVEYATAKKVKIAFENLRRDDYLDVIMKRYEKEPYVGFCYDCGHQHCYSYGEPVDYLALYGDRLLCTHIHDNFGRDQTDIWRDADEHIMPFDGNLDYTAMMKRLHKTGYTGALTLELCNQERYCEKTPAEFLAIAHERIAKIAALESQLS